MSDDGNIQQPLKLLFGPYLTQFFQQPLPDFGECLRYGCFPIDCHFPVVIADLVENEILNLPLYFAFFFDKEVVQLGHNQRVVNSWFFCFALLYFV